MLTVAIGTENSDHDGEVYRVLLERVLGRQVERYVTAHSFSGWRSVEHLAEGYLAEAARKGVRHALFAIDNDGGSKRHPEHEDAHDTEAQAADEGGCRWCWLAGVFPASWTNEGRRRVLVVPVQTLETWLLCLRDHPFATTPERTYPRRVLKKLFYGDSELPAEARVARAVAALDRPNALAVLRQRPSFRTFEAQLSDWP